MTKLVFATRRSALALAQSQAFADALARSAQVEVEALHIVTSGDRFVEQPLQDLGGKGLFVKELEEALLDGRADFAVHSIKDVPAELAPGLAIACVPPREDPRDALVTKTGRPLAELKHGALVGTSSLRRAVCLKRARPDLVIEPLRGNVDTRLRKCAEGPFDAVVLALAGLRRLGLEARVSEILSPEISLPAIGQGALGIECRAGDEVMISRLAALHDAETAVPVAAERALMAAVGGSCRMPVAAFGVREGDRIHLRAMLAEPDGSRLRTGERRVPWPSDENVAAELGRDLGAELRHG